MKYIYYPEYELEYRNLLGKGISTNHILNIRLLMFLCDHVILPPSHLLYTSSENILALTHQLQEFFDVGKIVTTRYPSGLDDYFDSRIDRIQDPVLRLAKTVQVNQIKNKLLFNHNIEHNQSDEKAQLSLFDTRVKELILASPNHKKKSLLLLDQMKAVSEKTGEPVYSNQFRNILADLSNRGDITKPQYSYFLDLMSNAYYYSGTYTMNTMVSYNNYFARIDLQNSLLNTHAGATNLIVDPHFLQRLFETMGISMQDICQLGVTDYQQIMSHKNWRNFIAIFDNLYTSAQALEELLKQRELLLEVYKKKKENVSKFLDIITNGLFLPVLLASAPLYVGIGVPLVILFLRGYLTPIKRFETFVKNNTTDKILDILERNNDPLYGFSYRLNATIGELTKE